MNSDFSSLNLPDEQLQNLASLGYATMTPIQAKALPLILEGKDVVAKAKTGSGKTAAFGIGLLSRLDVSHYRTQALVLCPTRELADQVSKELRRLARFTANIKILTLCGGVPMGPQLDSLVHPAHIVVGTPGRIQDHLSRQSLTLDHLKMLVLDEADRMLDMGFADVMTDVIRKTPKQRQTLLFSATYPEEIARISASVQRDPVEVSVEATHDSRHIEQSFIEVERGARSSALLHLLGHYQPDSCVIFCNTKRECQSVHDTLRARGISVLALHGDLEQRERDQVLVRFANKSCRVLVATDVAARGLDIKDLGAVINYEMAQDPEIHIHRIGRTGRAGQSGLAISFCTPQEAPRAVAIEEYSGQRLNWLPLESIKGSTQAELAPEMVTLCIDGGRKAKIRPGDILGALTGEAGLPGSEVGKIDLFDTHAYVAIRRASANKALKRLQQGKLKGKSCKARLID